MEIVSLSRSFSGILTIGIKNFIKQNNQVNLGTLSSFEHRLYLNEEYAQY